MSERPATVAIDGWHGRTHCRVTVVGETPKRYRVRVEEAFRVGRRKLARGEVTLIPKRALTFIGDDT